MKAYKVRRIYNNNANIRQYRVMFRDLVTFIFFLQEELNDINSKLDIMTSDPILTTEYNFAKDSLVKALEEIISLRL